MGIENIHIIIQPDDGDAVRRRVQIAEAQIRYLIQAHHRGEHTYGNMRRDCPLCQAA
jgi:hypothetical protein